MWATQNWVPREIGIALEAMSIRCFEGDQIRNYRNYPSSEIYELVGIVVDIASSGRQKHHLISFVDGAQAFIAMPSFLVLMFSSGNLR